MRDALCRIPLIFANLIFWIYSLAAVLCNNSLLVLILLYFGFLSISEYFFHDIPTWVRLTSILFGRLSFQRLYVVQVVYHHRLYIGLCIGASAIFGVGRILLIFWKYSARLFSIDSMYPFLLFCYYIEIKSYLICIVVLHLMLYDLLA